MRVPETKRPFGAVGLCGAGRRGAPKGLAKIYANRKTRKTQQETKMETKKRGKGGAMCGRWPSSLSS